MVVNPFHFGKAVKGKQFCNRKKELRNLSVAIKSGNSFWLYSSRRSGKTSLVINSFSRIKEVKTIYFDLFKIRDAKELAVKLLNMYSQELISKEQGVTYILKKLSNYLKDINLTISLDAMENPIIGIDIKPKELNRAIESILELPQKLNYPKPIYIAFDEFQEIERLEPRLKDIMSSVFQHQQNVNYVFLGSKESIMNSIFSDTKSLFFQNCEEMKLDLISSLDLALYIHTMFKETKLKIKQEIIEDILKISECHPHYTQYAAYFAWNLIYQKIPQDDRFKEIWLSRIIESQSHLFRIIYEQLNANQRKVLNAISDVKMQNILSNATMLKYDLPPKSTITTTLNSLLQKTLILRTNGSYKFENPIFKIWTNKLYD